MWAIEKGPKGEGVIIFYDFGMMNSFVRRLVDFFFAVYCTYLYTSGQSFHFPPTWTFVFWAFFSIDGIGKLLNPRYDLTKLTLPYLKKCCWIWRTATFLRRRCFELENAAINQAVAQPRRAVVVEDIVKRLEQGELNLRVRTLEVERELERSKLAKKNTFEAVLSGLLFQTV
jgi:predicted unusual protein kinase regulating ubiquinone biosynthesis (AarF/ABC1/UbiB family)